MTELTPEEKRKIYEEEKFRIDTQEKVRKKIKRKTKPTTWGCLILIILGIIILSGVFSPSKKSEIPPSAVQKREEIELKASVRFTGTQFIIMNNDSFDWINVKLEINPAFLKSGYVYNAKRIKPNLEYTVGAMQFTKSDGTRFNPFAIKPKEIFIAADTPKGRGYYSGGW